MIHKDYCHVMNHEDYCHDVVTCVDCKVGWRPTVRLHIDPPLLWVQSVGLQSSLLAQYLHLVNNLSATIVPLTRVALENDR